MPFPRQTLINLPILSWIKSFHVKPGDARGADEACVSLSMLEMLLSNDLDAAAAMQEQW